MGTGMEGEGGLVQKSANKNFKSLSTCNSLKKTAQKKHDDDNQIDDFSNPKTKTIIATIWNMSVS
jgi:hypothetical protein